MWLVLRYKNVGYTQSLKWLERPILETDMEKLIIALSAFGLVLLVVYLVLPDFKSFFEFAVKWMSGFAALIALDLVAELWVFELLGWNGTTKNDWFFMLWWVLVLYWFVRGLRQAKTAIAPHKAA